MSRTSVKSRRVVVVPTSRIGGPAPFSICGDLPGDVAPDEAEPLPGADVVERADDHQRQALGARVVAGVELLGGLRQGVGRERGPAPVSGSAARPPGRRRRPRPRRPRGRGPGGGAGPRRAGTWPRGSSGGRPRGAPTRCRPPRRRPGGRRGPGAWPAAPSPRRPARSGRRRRGRRPSEPPRLSVGAPGRTVPATSAPSRRASSARWLPAKPAMPVIRTFTAPPA